MFGWFKRKPVEPVVVKPAVRQETAEEARARLDAYRAECEARLEKLDALDRRGEKLTKDDRVVWYQGDEAIITNTYPIDKFRATLWLSRSGGSTTWATSSAEVVKLPK